MLLVEDNPDVASATEELLQRMGCQTEVVRDATAALKALADGHFDFLLSDIVMAGAMNGLDLARGFVGSARVFALFSRPATATPRHKPRGNSRCCASPTTSRISIGRSPCQGRAMSSHFRTRSASEVLKTAAEDRHAPQRKRR